MTPTITAVILSSLVNISVLIGLAMKLEGRLTALETHRNNLEKSIDELWKQFNKHREQGHV